MIFYFFSEVTLQLQKKIELLAKSKLNSIEVLINYSGFN